VDQTDVAIGWEGLLIVDSLLFSLTLRKAYQICRENGTVWIGKSLLFVFFRDGEIKLAPVGSRDDNTDSTDIAGSIYFL
jgi:hypothetical protein